MHIYCFSEARESPGIATQNESKFGENRSLALFLPVLKKLGSVEQVHCMGHELKEECLQKVENGEQVVLFAFCLPNILPLDWPCKVVSLFPWGYSSIPGKRYVVETNSGLEAENNPRSNWLNMLAKVDQIVTQSYYARDVLCAALGETPQVSVIPTPSYDPWKQMRRQMDDLSPDRQGQLGLSQTVIDSRAFSITPETIYPADNFVSTRMTESASTDSSNCIELKFGTFDSNILCAGFYEPEGWGMWSRSLSPWIYLPYSVQGKVRIKISMSAFGPNIDRNIRISIGSETATVVPSPEVCDYEFDLDLREAGNILRFENLSLTNRRRADDPRTLGIGLAQLTIQSLAETSDTSFKNTVDITSNSLILGGINYVVSLDPGAAKDNWREIIMAFCIALKRERDATLILLVEKPEIHKYIDNIFELWCQLSPFYCRVVVIHGPLGAADQEAIAKSTSYVVNVPRSAGESLPLMNFMSCGIPAVATDHTAMADYITEKNAFIVSSSPEPCAWPHDPQSRFYTSWYRLNWASLLQAFENSYETAKKSPEQYRSMSRNAAASLKSHCSEQRALEALQAILEQVS